MGVSALVLARGFRAVSDDDYARVVIAESWAHEPRFDASGTSWLPLPFWLFGAAMQVAGRSLETARGMALVLGVVSALVVYVAARWMREPPVAAGAGALAAAVFPWSAWLGAAMVPELPTAALALLAMAALVPLADGEAAEAGRRRLVGGAALLAATLSRYETWPVAVIFAAFSAADVRRRRAARPALLGGAALAIAGPLAWMAHNRVAHDDPLHFVARVAAYRQALGGVEGSAASRLLAYPIALVREAPELAALVVMAAALTAIRGAGAMKERLSPYLRPLAVVVGQIAALSLAMLKDGAPTHHPERAVLSAMLLAAVVGGALAVHVLGALASLRRALAAFALASAVLGAGVAGHARTREQAFVDRHDEEAIGREGAARVPAGERVLVEAVDYGYLAVQAAFGRPEDAIVDRTLDPRKPPVPSSFADAATLFEKLSAARAPWAAARVAEPVRAAMGPAIVARGGWGMFHEESAR
jgi:hypothetical protein